MSRKFVNSSFGEKVFHFVVIFVLCAELQTVCWILQFSDNSFIPSPKEWRKTEGNSQSGESRTRSQNTKPNHDPLRLNYISFTEGRMSCCCKCPFSAGDLDKIILLLAVGILVIVSVLVACISSNRSEASRFSLTKLMYCHFCSSSTFSVNSSAKFEHCVNFQIW